ncbi:hypothetical protein K2P97_09060 [bacterium]|nr:hypothetical protein [bacterium]
MLLFTYTAVLYFLIKWTKRYTALIFFNIVLFVFLKSINRFFPNVASPNGISFYFFSILGLLIDQKRSRTDNFNIRFDYFMLFPGYFVTLLAGPIMRAKVFFEQLQFTQKASFNNIVDGAIVFFVGFFKLQVLIAPLVQITTQLFASYRADHFYFWLACFLSTFRAYIEFSSYCDMGRGVSRCFGINLNINFKAFYYAKSPIDFWNRWNITIGEWLRDYLSFPLMLKFGKQINQSVLIILSFVILGLWHGISLNWALFGLFNGILVSCFYFLSRSLAQKPKMLGLFGYILAWVIFLGNGLFSKTNFIQLLSLKRSLEPGLMAQYSLLPWVICFFILLIFEFFQEKMKNVDFYLTWPNALKSFVAIVLLSLFLYQMTMQISDAPNILPPLYFRF